MSAKVKWVWTHWFVDEGRGCAAVGYRDDEANEWFYSENWDAVLKKTLNFVWIALMLLRHLPPAFLLYLCNNWIVPDLYERYHKLLPLSPRGHPFSTPAPVLHSKVCPYASLHRSWASLQKASKLPNNVIPLSFTERRVIKLKWYRNKHCMI